VGAVNAAHIEVEETVFEPIAAAYSAITPGERQQCIALLDIGAETSGLAIYEGDALLSAVSLPVSADHFTRDISVGLKIRYIDAEQLKVQYGCAIMGLTNDHVFVALPQAPGREPRDIALYEVNYILQERAAELFDHLLAELERIGVERNLMGGLVITGGGAALPGLLDMATRTLNCEARYGLTVAIDEWPDAMDNPQWTVAGGLAMYSARLKQRQLEDRRKRGFVTRFLLGGQ
jgi:cell division protein FtsA